MFSFTWAWILNIVFGSCAYASRADAEKYLAKASSESIHRDLTANITRHGRDLKKRLIDIFERDCVKSSSEAKYWNAEILRRYIRRTYSEEPHFDIKFYQLWAYGEENDTVIFESSRIPLPIPHDTSIVRLAQALFGHLDPQVVLFGNNAKDNTPKTVIGAYFPCRICSIYDEDTHNFKTSLVFFQLQPIFRTIQLGKPVISITPSNKTGEKREMISLAEIVRREGSPEIPYWIGAGTSKEGAGIKVDPEKRTITLVGGDRQWKGEFNAHRDEDDGSGCWEVTIHDPWMEMYTANEREKHTSRIPTMVKGEELEKLRKKIVEEVKYKDEKLRCAVLRTGDRMGPGIVPSSNNVLQTTHPSKPERKETFNMEIYHQTCMLSLFSKDAADLRQPQIRWPVLYIRASG
ncbi:hypothetical protein TESG_01242 [Trichophyton tonsurans CBS 112818]|uniref:Uncharacterized protein n=1 Tax=Trichophyton tonsurans (strain CBS 112818) TaxID=647933 RepID=F2RQV8_TRIT1|nr:hypothetical protein TESG_01242 [Trichophyton tonsurans CBS 112818]